MKKLLTATLLTTTIVMTNAQNPLFEPFTSTPHGTTPFDKITVDHYKDAVERGIKIAREEVDRICENPQAPTFANTIKALDSTAADLDRATGVFFPLSSAISNDEFMAVEDAILPMLSDYATSLTLNEKLWKRVKAVWDNRDAENLDPEDAMLLKTTYESFAHNGALLEGEDRERFKKLSARLSELSSRFGQNVLRELNTYEMWLTANDLSGLPESSIEAAAKAAADKGREGEYLFTLAQPTYVAFMKYSDRADLREKMYRLYMGRNLKGEFSNMEIIREIVNGRLEMARLMGHKSYSDYALTHTMAETPEGVYGLLDRLRDAYKPALAKEMAELAAYASEIEGREMTINPWDYSYYSNKLKAAKYSYDEEALRPYFELNNVINGVFGLATNLYGITFRENPDIPVYHPEVKAFEVLDPDGEYMGVIYTDFFPRDSKRPGAWMTDFKPEWTDEDGTISHPHVSIVMNFTKPTDTKPSLLTPYEVRTFLHEFGHALHGLMAATRYKSLSGTNVYRDFVELPSQFNENFFTQKQFLDGFARHYVTGETIPAREVERIITSSRFGAAYACMRQLGFGYTDMAWHTITEPLAEDADLVAFENAAMDPVAIFAPVEGALMSPQFNHIFSGGYASGYYSYKWAEVLDADAFSLFLEKGIYDPESARSFRDNILSRGGTEHPAKLYRRFRGQDATINALLKRDGIK